MPEKDLISKQLLQRLLIGFGNRLFGLNIVEAELLSNEQARIESRRADLVARVREANGENYILHIEIQNDNQRDMPLRMLRYYSDIALAHVDEKIVQYLLYIGKAPLSMSDHVHGYNLRYRYKVLDMRDQDSEHFLNSNNPDALAKGEARGIKKGEARGIKKGETRGLNKMVLKLLAKLPPEQVAELSDMSLAEVQAIAATNESL